MASNQDQNAPNFAELLADQTPAPGAGRRAGAPLRARGGTGFDSALTARERDVLGMTFASAAARAVENQNRGAVRLARARPPDRGARAREGLRRSRARRWTSSRRRSRPSRPAGGAMARLFAARLDAEVAKPSEKTRAAFVPPKPLDARERHAQAPAGRLRDERHARRRAVGSERPRGRRAPAPVRPVRCLASNARGPLRARPRARAADEAAIARARRRRDKRTRSASPRRPSSKASSAASSAASPAGVPLPRAR